MNPWMLHEVRKDDIAARYAEAEQSRLAAMTSDDSPRAAGKRAARWAVGITVGGSLLLAALTAFV